MPGKGHFPSFEERLVRTVKANTTRTVGGLGSMASPSQTRDRVAASRRGNVGLPPTARKSKVDWFEVVDDATDQFVLTFNPITDSWNVFLNGIELDEDPDGPAEFQIVGKTLTINGPADTFLGADTQGSPWRMRVQYDYLAGVPTTPAGIATFVDAASLGGFTGSLVGGTIPSHTAGDLLVVAISPFQPITVPAPSGGWTLQSSHVGTPGLFIFTKPGDGVETSWSVAAGGTWYESVCLAYEDATFGAADETAGSGTSHDTPGIAGGGTFLHIAASLAAVVPPVIGGTMRRDNSQTGSSPYINAHETPTGSPLTYSAGSSTAWASATVRVTG